VQPDPHLRRRTTRRHGVVDLLHVHVRGPGGAGGRGRVGCGPGEVHRQPHVGLPRAAPSRLTPGPWRGAVVQRSLHRWRERLRCSMFELVGAHLGRGLAQQGREGLQQRALADRPAEPDRVRLVF
jgi:hypothetical protein